MPDDIHTATRTEAARRRAFTLTAGPEAAPGPLAVALVRAQVNHCLAEGATPAPVRD